MWPTRDPLIIKKGRIEGGCSEAQLIVSRFIWRTRFVKLHRAYKSGIRPCFKLPTPSKERRRDRVLTDEELKKVWKALGSEKSAAIADAFKLRLLTAQRGGEVLAMRWAEVDLNAR